MEPEDLDEALRIIGLHDTDDREAASAWFSEERTGYVALVGVDEGEGRLVGLTGYAADAGEGQDVHWLGWTYVNPWCQRRGIGQALLDEVIRGVRAAGGRKLFLETSSLGKYDPAVAFYRRNGFAEEGRLLDFYAPGEHKLLMGRAL
jgi:ribosomal protein S18 acetylase RimI-like enzyme